MYALLSITILVVISHHALGYKILQGSIPNGNNVPHPCRINAFWEGVGHFADAGSGYRNAFGEDFAREGKVWTATLCAKDSDGDGKTNGEELGDPDCKWTPNTPPSRLTSLSHPGVCDPWNSPACIGKNVTHPKYKTQGEWIQDVCKTDSKPCPAISEPGVKSAVLRLSPGNAVPAKETTYMCKMFDMDNVTSPGDYHIVAVEPILDNTYVIHHMILFGCLDDAELIPGEYECGMLASERCQKFLSTWTVGLKEDCHHPNAGIRIGTNGYKKFAIQLHWNNPDKRATWTDSSGLKIYYTTNRRQYDAGIFMTGLQSFVLPPRRLSIPLQSTCTSTCTRSFMKGPAYVTMAWNHMHYAGTRMSIEVIRGSSRLMYLTKEDAYNYDSPQVSYFTDSPVQLLPGDQIITKCEFNTMRKNRSTLFGEATKEEMCFGFLTFYPLENITQDLCVGAGPDVLYCDPSTYGGCSDLFSYYNYTYLNTTSFFSDVFQSCDAYGPCLEECREIILAHRKKNPCLRDDIFDFIKHQMWRYDEIGNQLIDLFASCELEVYKALNPITPVTQTLNNSPTTTSVMVKGNNSYIPLKSYSLFIVTALALGFRFLLA